MAKRSITIFILFCFSLGCLCLRLYKIDADFVSTASTPYYKTITVSSIRGNIYDCNMQKLVNNDYNYVIAAKPTKAVMLELKNNITSEEYLKAYESYKNRKPIIINVAGIGDLVSSSEIKIVKVLKRYSSASTASNIIGYIDYNMNGVTGIEKYFNDYLNNKLNLNISFSVDAKSNILYGDSIKISDDYYSSKSGVKLTLDSGIQLAAENALVNNNIKKGAVAVIDIKTGAVKAIASSPFYNQNNISSYLNNKNSPLVNKALQSYAVGSVFKVAVAAAALEKGVSPDYSYVCTGSTTIGKTVFHCNNSEVHGKINMSQALMFSCNNYFINLSEKIGYESLLETANNFGFGQSINLGNGLTASSGVLPEKKELANSQAALANFSFGQGQFTANILQVSQMMCAVANGGKYYIPYLVEGELDSNGKIIKKYGTKANVVAFSKTSADKLKKMLVKVVEDGNSSKAKPEASTAGGKTATAQTGQMDKNGTESLCTWFSGFFPGDEPQYVITVIKDSGVTGATDCAPVFKEIADYINK